MLVIDRAGHGEHFLTQRLAYRRGYGQVIDQGEVEGFLDLVGQVLLEKHRKDFGDAPAILLCGALPVEPRQARPEHRMTSFIEQVVGH
ncbi:hypothetical protein D9M73_256280 [compost metagenome]